MGVGMLPSSREGKGGCVPRGWQGHLGVRSRQWRARVSQVNEVGLGALMDLGADLNSLAI